MKDRPAKVYQKSLLVKEEHLDELGHVNNVQYLQWVQDIAKEHWFSEFPNSSIQEEYWVVLEHTIQYKNAALLGDELSLQTFVEPPIGVKFPRNVHIYRNDQLITNARSIWCFIDAKSNRPKRVSKEILAAFGL